MVVGSLTALGYLLSTLRDALLASYYGGSPALDVYFIALSPVQFIGMEGASLVYLAFLPEFTRALRADDASAYGRLFRARLKLTGKAAFGAAAIMASVGVGFTQWLAPGYAGHHAIGSLRVSFGVLSALIPGLALLGVMRGALEARARFSAWALLPGIRSVTLIVCVLLSAPRPQLGWLLAGSLLGVALAIRYAAFAGRDHETVSPSSGAVLESPAASLPPALAPLVIAVLLGALTSMVDNAFASKAGVGGAQAFALATNLLVAPQGIIGGVVATVFFPVHGALWLDDQKPAAIAGLWKSVRMVVVGLLPVVILFVTAGTAIVGIVYKHGLFREDLAALVSRTVAGLALGQIFYACSVLLRQFLLVAGKPWAVCEAAALFLGVKWIGNALLLRPFGLAGVALASSFAAFTTCGYLAVRVIRLARTLGVRGA